MSSATSTTPLWETVEGLKPHQVAILQVIDHCRARDYCAWLGDLFEPEIVNEARTGRYWRTDTTFRQLVQDVPTTRLSPKNERLALYWLSIGYDIPRLPNKSVVVLRSTPLAVQKCDPLLANLSLYHSEQCWPVGVEQHVAEKQFVETEWKNSLHRALQQRLRWSFARNQQGFWYNWSDCGLNECTVRDRRVFVLYARSTSLLDDELKTEVDGGRQLHFASRRCVLLGWAAMCSRRPGCIKLFESFLPRRGLGRALYEGIVRHYASMTPAVQVTVGEPLKQSIPFWHHVRATDWMGRKL